jgi:hypothetical protein
VDHSKVTPTVRTVQLAAIGDVIDVCNIRLLRVEALARAIFCGAENGMGLEQLGTLADMTEDEARQVQGELEKFWNNLTSKGSTA